MSMLNVFLHVRINPCWLSQLVCIVGAPLPALHILSALPTGACIRMRAKVPMESSLQSQDMQMHTHTLGLMYRADMIVLVTHHSCD